MQTLTYMLLACMAGTACIASHDKMHACVIMEPNGHAHIIPGHPDITNVKERKKEN